MKQLPAIIIFILPVLLFSGEISLYEIDTTSYPHINMRCDIYSNDYGLITDSTDANFVLKENNQQIFDYNIQCHDILNPVEISVVVAMDVSGSMLIETEDGITRYELIVQAVKQFINIIDFHENSEAAILTFSNEIGQNSGFSSNKYILRRFIDTVKLTEQTATSYINAFTSENGIFSTLKKSRTDNQKIVIFITDGFSEDYINNVIDQAVRENIKVYPITLSAKMPDKLERMAENTKSKSFEIYNLSYAFGVFSEILHQIQPERYCTLTYKSNDFCSISERIKQLDVNYIPEDISGTTWIYIDPKERVKISQSFYNNMFIYDGFEFKSDTLWIYAEQKDSYIDTLYFSTNSDKFSYSIDDNHFPIKIASGDSLPVYLHYENEDFTERLISKLNILTSPCPLEPVICKAPYSVETNPSVNFDAVRVNSKFQKNSVCLFSNYSYEGITVHPVIRGSDETYFELQDEGKYHYVPSGDSLFLDIIFLPKEIREYHAYIDYELPVNNENYYTFLNGNGTMSDILAKNVEFGKRLVGGKFDTTLAIINTSVIDIDIYRVIALDRNDPDYDIKQLNSIKIPSGDTLFYPFSFTPQTVGLHTNAIVIDYTGANSDTVALSGNGFFSGFENYEINYPDKRILTQNDTSLSIINNTNIALRLSAINEIINTSNAYDIVDITDPIILQPGDTARIEASFTPPNAGYFEAEYEVVTETIEENIYISFKGNGFLPEILYGTPVFQPVSKNNQSIGFFEILNSSSNTDLSVTGISIISGSNVFSDDITISFPHIIKPGENIPVNVTFKPSDFGDYTGSIEILSDALPGPETYPLRRDTINFTAISTGFSLDSTRLIFPPILSCDSSEKVLKIFNESSVEVQIDSIIFIPDDNNFIVQNPVLNIKSFDSLELRIMFVPLEAINYHTKMIIFAGETSDTVEIIAGAYHSQAQMSFFYNRLVVIPGQAVQLPVHIDIPEDFNIYVNELKIFFDYNHLGLRYMENSFSPDLPGFSWIKSDNQDHTIEFSATISDPAKLRPFNFNIRFMTFIHNENEITINSGFEIGQNLDCINNIGDNLVLVEDYCLRELRKLVINSENFYLNEISPNPVEENFNLTYGLGIDCHVEISIFNTLGQKVSKVRSQKSEKGDYNINHDVSSLGSGVYTLLMKAGPFSKAIPLIIER